MRFITYTILCLITFIIQTTLFEYIQISSIKPNSLLILVVSFAFMRGQIEGALIGAFIGFLIDVFFGQFLGINIFIYTLIGFLCGKIFKQFYKDSIMIPFFLTLFSSIVYNILFLFLNIFLRGQPNIFQFLNSIIIPEALYTSMLSFFVYRIFYAINKSLDNFKTKNIFNK